MEWVIMSLKPGLHFLKLDIKGEASLFFMTVTNIFSSLLLYSAFIHVLCYLTSQNPYHNYF